MPEYAEGPLVKVARGESQPEAEVIAGLLLEEGIPSMLRRSGGFDVPDFMAAGPRDVMVPESAASAADSRPITSRGPAAMKSGTSNPPERRSMLGIPSSSSRPAMNSASG